MTGEMIDFQLQYCDDDSIDDSLLCLICFNIPNRAKELPCCLATICSLCARKWLKSNLSCPFCRSNIDPSAITKGLPDHDSHQKILRELMVVCPCVKMGCEWTGKRKFIYKHLKNKCSQFQGNRHQLNR